MTTSTRVLVVDDDMSVQTSLTAYLEDEGFALRSAASAPEALAVLAVEPIDVAIVDIRLGEMDGESLILKANALQSGTRFLIYTGSLSYQLPEPLMRIGMSPSDVMYKPVRSLQLIADQIRRVARKENDHVQQ